MPRSSKDVCEAKLRSLSERPAKSDAVRAESEHKHAIAHQQRCEMELQRAQEASSDIEVFAEVENRRKDLKSAESSLADAQAQLVGRNAEDVAMSLEGAKARSKNLRAEVDQLDKRNWQIKAELRSFDSANEDLAQSESKVERLQRDVDSVMRNANAVQALYDALETARTDRRNELAAPLMDKFLEYGQSVFGADTTFEMSDDLKIVGRSNGAGSFATEHLSGGAQEQIDILLRLAAAGIMEGGAGAPVIIDDALGYSDSNRIRLMNNALGRAGKDSQVIVLTCDKRRFDRIPGARFVDINDL